MSRPEPAAGFVGNLVDFRPQRGTRLLTATVVLPHRDIDRFHQAVGMPAAGVDVGKGNARAVAEQFGFASEYSLYVVVTRARSLRVEGRL